MTFPFHSDPHKLADTGQPRRPAQLLAIHKPLSVVLDDHTRALIFHTAWFKRRDRSTVALKNESAQEHIWFVWVVRGVKQRWKYLLARFESIPFSARVSNLDQFRE